MNYVIENYIGTKEATSKLELLQNSQKKRIDSLNTLFNNMYLVYKSDTNNRNLYNNLIFIKSKIDTENQTNKEKYDEVDLRLSQGIINQLNNFLEKNCNEEGIDILLGNTNGEGVLFALPQWDITDDFLEMCNERYEGNVY